MTDESPKEEILINVTPSEVRAALLENGVLQEVYVDRTASHGLISNVYKGRVSRVLPGMQAAFVDIGLERTAFLHVSDISGKNGAANSDDLPDIRELVREGDELLVQVVKEERGNKGAALTTYLSLAGRYCVLMPNTARGGGISRKITSATDRKRLKSVADDLDVREGMGLIIRTAGAKRTKAEIKRDADRLDELSESKRRYEMELEDVRAQVAELAVLLDDRSEQRLETAAQAVQKLQFLNKLLAEAEAAEADLEEAH